MTLAERWAKLPRAALWALAAAGFLAAYFLLVEPVLELTGSIDARADALEAARRRAALPAEEALDAAARDHALFGSPLPPGGPERTGALNQRLETILAGRDLQQLSIKARPPAPMPRADASRLTDDSRTINRLVVDIDFHTDPATAADIIAQLERAPEVTLLSRVTLRRVERDGAELLQVGLSPETWVAAPKAAPQ